MKKLSLSVLAVLAAIQLTNASVTINIGMGEMFANGSTLGGYFPLGGRINFLALESGSWSNQTTTFSNLTSSFVPTGSVLLGSVYNDNSGGFGLTGGQISFSYSGNLNAGDEIIAVAYPTLTISSTSPGNNTKGFYFRTSSVIDGSDIAWVAPSDGSNVALYAYTINQGGTLSNSTFTAGSGAAGGGGFTTVPEPSTYALLAVGAVGLFLSFRRRKVQS